MSMGRVGGAAAVFFAAATIAAPAGTAVPLATGAATYLVSLAEPEDSGALVGLDGQMTVALTRSCETHTTEVELAATFEGAFGDALSMTVRSLHIEGDSSLEFDLFGELASMEIDRAKGIATREGETVSVALSEPREEILAFDEDILFPLAMTQAAVSAAMAGEDLAEFMVYDGSGGGRDRWLVSVLIGAAPESGSDPSDEALFAAGLGFADMQRWRMRFSYFPPDAMGDLTPVFATEAIVYENGFSQAAVYDFGQFKLKLDLSEFRPIAPEPCQ